MRLSHLTTSAKRLSLIAASFGFGLAFAPLSSYALGQTGFQSYAGSWSGSGTLSHQSGVTERILCQARYVLQGPDSMQQTLRCRSDSTTFDLTSDITDSDGQVTGSWIEHTRNAQGRFSGSISRNNIRGTVQGPGFVAGISIGVAGSRQVAEIDAQGSDVSKLRLSLKRSSR